MPFAAAFAYNVKPGAYQGAGLFDYQGSFGSGIDTHDGFDGNRKRHEEERVQREELRSMLFAAVDPQAALALSAPAAELAAPFVARLESGAPRIDWEGIAREATVRAQLEAYAAEYARQVRDFEEDEEDVALLLWH